MKVDFEYSQVYDELLSYMSRNQYENKQYLDMQVATLEFQKYWKKNENKINLGGKNRFY